MALLTDDLTTVTACSDRPCSAPRIRLARRQLMLDQEVQGMLINRVVLYWFVCLAGTGLAAWSWSIFTQEQPLSIPAIIVQLAPAWIGSLILLPLCLVDILRQSNRFVGPVLRMRNTMKCVQLGDAIEPMQARDDDFWGDLIDRFNEIAQARSRCP